MLNEVVLMGRLTKDPETRFIQVSNNSCTRFTLAVTRNYKVNNEEKTDFINCIAWNKTGEFIDKYFNRGSLVAVCGSIETGSYTDKDGKKVYTFEVNVNKVSFTGDKKPTGSSSNNASAPQVDDHGFMNIPDGIDEEMPFR